MSYPKSKRIIVLNNEGVHMIKNGRYEQAIKCFISAVQLMNHNLVLMRDIQPSSISTGLGDSFSMIQGDHQVLSVPIGAFETQYVFRNPIVLLRQGLTDHKMKNQDVISHIFLITLYNLALSYHLAALESGCARRLEQALAYYALSYKMLLSERDVDVSQAMVILNNIGHIHRLMKNEEGANNCFQYLLTTMLFVQQSGESNRIQNWDPLISNVLHLMIAAGPRPAAAA